MKGLNMGVGRVALFAALLSSGATAAYGQVIAPDAPPSADPTSAAPQDAAPDPAQEGGDIVVTGSRIARKDYSAQSPILTIGEGQIEKAGTPTIEGALNQLPQFQPSAGAASAFPPRGGQANINLRGLGTNRALVLLDGRRIVPANADGTVDVNILPQQLIANVETITGGASTAYGSDAMAGVVNFRLKDNFKGVQLYGQAGVSDKGDGGTYDLSAIGGTSFGDGRGHLSGFVGYSRRDPVFRGDRDFFERSGSSNLAFLPMGVADLGSVPPTQAAINTVFGRYGLAAGTVTGRAYGFNADGTLFTTANTPIANYRGQTSRDIRILNNSVLFNTGAFYNIQIPLDRVTAFASADFDVSGAFKPYISGLYTHYTAQVQYGPALIGGKGQTTTIAAVNPFITADLRTLLNSRANPNAPFIYRAGTIMFGPLQQDQDYDVYQVTAGFKGKIPSTEITYDVYGSYGRTDSTETFRNGLNFPNLQRVLNAADGGASLCAGGFNPFGENLPSQSCIDYLKTTGVNRQSLVQKVVEAAFTGPLFSLPAGELRFAAGAQYRENSYSLVADPTLARGDITGFGLIGSGAGSDNVKEVFGELLIPIIHDTPLIKQFELGLAARYSDYDSVGGVTTYKADFDWKVFTPLRLRGGYSRAVRAPSLGDLFGAPTTASIQIGNPVVAGTAVLAGDPCDVRGAYRRNAGANAAAIRALCIAQGVPTAAVDSYQYNNVTVFAVNQGNPTLSEEKADTFSVGAVISSPFSTPLLSHLSVSVDYYSIKIADAIGTLGLATSLNRCFNAVDNPTFSATNIYCQQLPRQPDGFIALAAQPLLNLATFKTSGIDAQVDWRIDMADFGVNDLALNLNFAGTYVRRFLNQELPGASILDYVGTTGPVSSAPVYPRFKSIGTLTFDLGNIDISGKWRHVSAVEDFSRVLNPTSVVAGVSQYNYFDADIRIALNDQFQFQFGIVNIGDREPPQVGTAVGNTDFSTYDVIGRRFYVSARAKF